MRQLINIVSLTETVKRNYYLHITPRSKLSSIKRKGLIANHGGGNYQGSEFESLDGVYLTNDTTLISHMIENRDDLSDYGLVIIEANPEILLPDEDFIDMILNDLRIRGEEMSQREMTQFLIHEFHKEASQGADITLDKALLKQLVTVFLSYCEGIDDGDNDEWLAIKKQVTQIYRNMRNPRTRVQNSFRYPGSIGFNGQTRIVAILRVRNDVGTIIFGSVPPEASRLIEPLVDLTMTRGDISSAKEELFKIAIRVLPESDSDELRQKISKMSPNELRQNIRSGKERLARQN